LTHPHDLGRFGLLEAAGRSASAPHQGSGRRPAGVRFASERPSRHPGPRGSRCRRRPRPAADVPRGAAAPCPVPVSWQAIRTTPAEQGGNERQTEGTDDEVGEQTADWGNEFPTGGLSTGLGRLRPSTRPEPRSTSSALAGGPGRTPETCLPGRRIA
jgi:hypothetical protein